MSKASAFAFSSPRSRNLLGPCGGIFMAMPMNSLQRLRRALDVQRQALEELDEALFEVEEAFLNEAPGRPNNNPASQLLSIEEVCQTLGMGKSWTYRRIKSGEIPSVKLGRSIKVRRQDLEEYLESRRYQPTEEE